MSDELNDPAIEAYRDASYADAKGGGTLDAEKRAAAVIRDYGDKRYQQAIADVVEWLLIVGKEADEILPNGGELARRFSREATRRFGKDA